MVQPALPTVLLTGFDPFGEAAINPSWQAVQTLQGRQIKGHRIVTAQLPTVFGQSVGALKLLIRQHRPTVVLCVGQAGGRNALSLERVAINLNDARIPDNTGAQPVDTPVVAGGPAAYFSTLPIKAMVQTLQQQGIAAEVSHSAGTFVCNHVFYALMHHLATTRGLKTIRGGFMHVPYLPEQGSPSLPLATVVQGLRLALRVALTRHDDIHVPAGTLY